MAATQKPHEAHKGKKGRKIGRNFRWDGVSHSTTKYRSRHHIDPAAKRRKA
jgi:hypothetical protein